MRYLVVAEKFIVQGREQIRWNKIGEISTGKDGTERVRLFMHPGLTIQVFDEGKAKPATDAFGADLDFNKTTQFK